MVALLRRLAAALWLLAGAFVLCFLLFQLLPADPVRAALGPYASPDAVRSVRESLGLDLPLGQRFFRSVSGAATGDWGKSIVDGRAVLPLVWQRFLTTASIGLFATALAAAFSLAVNLAAAFWQPAAHFIRMARKLSYLPAFVVAFTGALVLAFLFPAISLSSGPSTIVLAIVLAALHPGALLGNLLHERIAVEQTSSQWRAANAFGHGGLSLVFRSLFRPVAVSWLAAVVNQVSGILFTVLLIEVTFSLPGLGTLFLEATQRADLPVLQGVVLVNALFFLTIATMSEFAYDYLDPRVR